MTNLFNFPDGGFKGVPSPPIRKMNTMILSKPLRLKAGEYVFSSLLDEGALTNIYFGENVSGDYIVGKTIKDPTEVYRSFSSEDYNKILIGFDREIDYVKKMQGVDGFVQYKDDFKDGDKRYFIMDYLPGITLQKYLEVDGKPLPVTQAIYLIHKIAQAVKHIHAHNFVHSDLKPENIMIVGRNPILLGFGSIQEYLREQNSAVIFIPGYRAPEKSIFGISSPYGDIYSLTMILITLLIGTYKSNCIFRQRYNDFIKNIKYEIDDFKSDIKDLILHQITKESDNYTERYSIDQFITVLEKIARFNSNPEPTFTGHL